jgi:hypothetical protein
MIALERFSRRERWVRFIIDELDRRHPLVFKRLGERAKRQGTTLLAIVRERRAQLQAERRAA